MKSCADILEAFVKWVPNGKPRPREPMDAIAQAVVTIRESETSLRQALARVAYLESELAGARAALRDANACGTSLMAERNQARALVVTVRGPDALTVALANAKADTFRMFQKWQAACDMAEDLRGTDEPVAEVEVSQPFGPGHATKYAWYNYGDLPMGKNFLYARPQPGQPSALHAASRLALAALERLLGRVWDKGRLAAEGRAAIAALKAEGVTPPGDAQVAPPAAPFACACVTCGREVAPCV